MSTFEVRGGTLLKYSAPAWLTCNRIWPPSGALTRKLPLASEVTLAISSMLCAVLMTPMVSPAEGFPVVRLVTTPEMEAASAAVAQRVTQKDGRRVRSV